jgi:hypothetical protein
MSTNFEQAIERLATDGEISDLASRFSDAVNRRDFDAFGDLFATTVSGRSGSPSRAGRPGGKTSWRCSGTVRAPVHDSFHVRSPTAVTLRDR